MTQVIHVSSSATAKGSRIYMQCDMFPGEVIATDAMTGGWNLNKRLLSPGSDVFIYHQHSHLPALLLGTAIVRLFHRKHRFVFDMHDLAEITHYMNWKGRVWSRLLGKMEGLLDSLGVPVMTVSKGLSQIFFQNHGFKPLVVMNVPASVSSARIEAGKSSNRGVYFGHIKPERLPIELVHDIQKRGIVLDLYGIIPGWVDEGYSAEILEIVSQSGGQFRGKYDANDLSFLREYDISFMPFEVNRLNVRYCMPNKLFQSLDMHVACVVSPGLEEVMQNFGDSGSVVSLIEFFEHQSPTPNWEKSDDVISAIRANNLKNYLAVLGVKESEEALTELSMKNSPTADK